MKEQACSSGDGQRGRMFQARDTPNTEAQMWEWAWLEEKGNE